MCICLCLCVRVRECVCFCIHITMFIMYGGMYMCMCVRLRLFVCFYLHTAHTYEKPRRPQKTVANKYFQYTHFQYTHNLALVPQHVWILSLHTHTHTRAQTHTRADAHTHTNTHVHTHTHTHTRTSRRAATHRLQQHTMMQQLTHVLPKRVTRCTQCVTLSCAPSVSTWPSPVSLAS